jgi:hypothetical protein
MTSQDERALRGRLTALLDSVEPASPPVGRTMRRARGIKMRRWASVAAVASVLGAGAVVLPALIRGHHAVAPMAPRHYKVTVRTLGPTANAGVVGAGTIDNKHWRIVIDNTMGSGCTTQPYELICGPKYAIDPAPSGVSIGGASEGGTQFQYGTVGSDVTRVVIRLSDGTQLDLRPVSAAGYRWVAIAAPVHAMVEAETFVGRSEYSYAIPFVVAGYSEFVTWLRPGQLGVQRDGKQVGSGIIDGATWRNTLEAGPWGYCVTFAAGSACTPAPTPLRPPGIGKPLLQLACTRPFNSHGEIPASSGVVVMPAGVKNLVLWFADGSRQRLVALPVAGLRVVGYAIPSRPKPVRTLEYGFAGQLVGTVSKADWGC